MTRTRLGSALVPAGLALVALVVAGCEVIAPVPAGRIDCGGDTPQDLCRAIALAAISGVDQAATGRIDLVQARSVPCREWARANFRVGVYGDAFRCWTVDVIGRRSRGWSVVYQAEDGGPLKVDVPLND